MDLPMAAPGGAAFVHPADKGKCCGVRASGAACERNRSDSYPPANSRRGRCLNEV
jgi:hypothetical protein